MLGLDFPLVPALRCASHKGEKKTVALSSAKLLSASRTIEKQVGSFEAASSPLSGFFLKVSARTCVSLRALAFEKGGKRAQQQRGSNFPCDSFRFV